MNTANTDFASIVPMDIIRHFIRIGGGKQHSRHRIAFYYASAREKDFLSLLKKEYRNSSAGLIIGGNRYVMLCDNG